MSRSRMSHDVPGQTARVPTAIQALLLLAAVSLAGCARVTSPQENDVPGTPAPAAAATPADTTPAELPPAEPEPEEMPVETPPLEARALTDVHWRLTDLGEEPVVATGGIPDREPYIHLAVDGTTVTGATGCNTFSGPYTLTGDALSFGALVATKVACTDPAMADQETRFLGALDTADRFEINGDVLTLYAGMTPIARFEADTMP